MRPGLIWYARAATHRARLSAQQPPTHIQSERGQTCMAMPNVKRGAFAYALQLDAVFSVRENTHLFLALFKYPANGGLMCLFALSPSLNALYHDLPIL